MELRTLRPRPVVDSLLLRASEHAVDGALHHAESFFAAAVAADSGPTALIAYGTFLAELGETGDALKQLHAGWELAKMQQHPAARAWACHSLAAAYRQCGEFVVGQQYQQLAIAAELDADIDSTCGALSQEIRLGSVADWMQSGEFGAAERLLATCLHTTDALEESPAALMNYGALALRAGDVCGALGHFRAAQERFRAEEDQNGVSHALESIGRTLLIAGELSAAREALELANRMARHLGQRHRVRRIAAQIVPLDRAIGVLTSDHQLN